MQISTVAIELHHDKVRHLRRQDLDVSHVEKIHASIKGQLVKDAEFEEISISGPMIQMMNPENESV